MHSITPTALTVAAVLAVIFFRFFWVGLIRRRLRGEAIYSAIEGRGYRQIKTLSVIKIPSEDSWELTPNVYPFGTKWIANWSTFDQRIVRAYEGYFDKELQLISVVDMPPHYS